MSSASALSLTFANTLATLAKLTRHGPGLTARLVCQVNTQREGDGEREGERGRLAILASLALSG